MQVRMASVARPAWPDREARPLRPGKHRQSGQYGSAAMAGDGAGRRQRRGGGEGTRALLTSRRALRGQCRGGHVHTRLEANDAAGARRVVDPRPRPAGRAGLRRGERAVVSTGNWRQIHSFIVIRGQLLGVTNRRPVDAEAVSTTTGQVGAPVVQVGLAPLVRVRPPGRRVLAGQTGAGGASRRGRGKQARAGQTARAEPARGPAGRLKPGG